MNLDAAIADFAGWVLILDDHGYSDRADKLFAILTELWNERDRRRNA